MSIWWEKAGVGHASRVPPHDCAPALREPALGSLHGPAPAGGGRLFLMEGQCREGAKPPARAAGCPGAHRFLRGRGLAVLASLRAAPGPGVTRCACFAPRHRLRPPSGSGLRSGFSVAPLLPWGGKLELHDGDGGRAWAVPPPAVPAPSEQRLRWRAGSCLCASPLPRTRVTGSPGSRALRVRAGGGLLRPSGESPEQRVAGVSLANL